MPDAVIAVGLKDAELVDRLVRIESECGLTIVEHTDLFGPGVSGLALSFNDQPVIMVPLRDEDTREDACRRLLSAYDTVKADLWTPLTITKH